MYSSARQYVRKESDVLLSAPVREEGIRRTLPCTSTRGRNRMYSSVYQYARKVSDVLLPSTVGEKGIKPTLPYERRESNLLFFP